MGSRRWTDEQEDNLYAMRMGFEKLSWREFTRVYQKQGRGLARTAQALCKRFKRVAEKRRRQTSRERETTAQIVESCPDSREAAGMEWSLLREQLLAKARAISATRISSSDIQPAIADNDALGTVQNQIDGHAILPSNQERFYRWHNTIPIGALDYNAGAPRSDDQCTVQLPRFTRRPCSILPRPALVGSFSLTSDKLASAGIVGAQFSQSHVVRETENI